MHIRLIHLDFIFNITLIHLIHLKSHSKRQFCFKIYEYKIDFWHQFIVCSHFHILNMNLVSILVSLYNGILDWTSFWTPKRKGTGEIWTMEERRGQEIHICFCFTQTNKMVALKLVNVYKKKKILYFGNMEKHFLHWCLACNKLIKSMNIRARKRHIHIHWHTLFTDAPIHRRSNYYDTCSCYTYFPFIFTHFRNI